jgi:Ser/Thr protein kinase RdoA (MazF antagonist)
MTIQIQSETGTVNYIYCSVFRGREVVVKQYRRHKDSAPVENPLRSCKYNRMQRETQVLIALAKNGVDFSPRIVHAQPERNILRLSYVPGTNCCRRLDLLCSHIGIAIAMRRLRQIHRLRPTSELLSEDALRVDRHIWRSLFEFRIRPIQSSLGAEVYQQIETFWTKTAKSSETNRMLHRDYCPKNLLWASSGRLNVLDYETSGCLGDGLYDAGFFLGHVLLHQRAHPKTWQATIAHALEEYCGGVPTIQMSYRVALYAAATMLYRLGQDERLHLIPGIDSSEKERIYQQIRRVFLLEQRLDQRGGVVGPGNCRSSQPNGKHRK